LKNEPKGEIKMRNSVIINLCFAFLCGLLWQSLLPFAFAQSYEVTYTYGFIEVKRHGQETWERVSKNQKLSEEDWVRVPPESVFRIREPNGEFANIPAGQESRMRELVRLRKRKVAGVTEYTSGLPTDSEVQSKSPASGQEKGNKKKLPPGFSEELLSSKVVVDDTVKAFVSKVKKNLTKERLAFFPNENLALAHHLFSDLKAENIQPLENPTSVQLPGKTLSQRHGTGHGTDYDYAVLYCAMLRDEKIPTEILLHGDGVYVIFNSGVPNNESLRVTSNPGIYFSREGFLWLPLRLAISEANFLSAWYHGKKVVLHRKLMNLDSYAGQREN
jgi:hypothetical protein